MALMFFKRAYFRPDDYRKSVSDIDYDRLKSQGVDILFIDLDNTLAPYDESLPSIWAMALLKRLLTAGFTIVLISNNHEARVKRFAAAVGLPYIYSAKKPFGFGYRRAEKRLGRPDRSRICVIGDQLMTDVYGAKRLGYRAILVDALKRKTEKWFTRINRVLEQKALADMQKADPAWFAEMKLAEKR